MTTSTASAALNQPFRDDVRRCLGARDATVPEPLSSDGRAERLVVWALASSGSSGRRIQNERAVIELVEALLLADDGPSAWRLQTIAMGQMLYLDQLRLIANASLYVSLFGGSFNNARVMPAGAAALEIHAALKNDFGADTDYLYKRLCADALGLRWFGYAPRGFRPVVSDVRIARNATLRAEMTKRGASSGGDTSSWRGPARGPTPTPTCTST